MTRPTRTNSTAVAGKTTSKKDDELPPPEKIIKLVIRADATLFHNPMREGFVELSFGGHRETHRLRDSAFKHLLAGLYYEREGKAASAEAINTALNALEARALFAGKQQSVHVRVASHGGNIYVDLADENWRALEVTGSGWKVVSRPPVRFWRPAGMLALPTPVRGGSLAELRPFVNVRSQELFLLVLSWLIATFRGRGPYPVLVIEGLQGSAKSTTTRLLRDLIDPNAAPLRAFPKDERDLMIAASNGWCLAFENISGVSPSLSDCLCRLSTGGGFSVRKHYCDDQEKLFDVQRPVVMNGISVGVHRPDLLDRSLIIPLSEISDEKRQREEEFWRQFELAKPRIFGAIMDAVSCALRRLPEVSMAQLPRMADYTAWSLAAEPTFGCESGAFLRAYNSNRADADEVALANSLIAPVLEEVLQCTSKWRGTAANLLKMLDEEDSVDRRQKGWPRTAGQLSGELRRIQPSLRSVGIVVQFNQTPGTNSRKIITLERVPQTTARR
jgi:hypothetical protein